MSETPYRKVIWTPEDEQRLDAALEECFTLRSSSWFPGNIKPDSPGLYQNLILDFGYGDEIHETFFDGENWVDDEGLTFIVQERQWRGIQ